MALRPEFTLESANRRGRGFLPGLFGFRVTAIEEDRLDAELDVRPEIRAPNGYLHAATVVALADTACGYGCLAHLPADATNFTTIELKTNFLGTAREGTIACTARPCISAARRTSGTQRYFAKAIASRSRSSAVRR